MNILLQIVQNETTLTDSITTSENSTSTALDAVSLIMIGGIVMIT